MVSSEWSLTCFAAIAYALKINQFRMPTARDATSAMVANDIADSAIIRSLALTVSGKVSAGENAVAFVKARNR